jgi:DNA ligase (NAD+)
MLSLGNLFGESDLREWEEKRDEEGRLRGGLRLQLERAGSPQGGPLRYVVEPKLDGLAIELVYENGLLVGAGTRGDGMVGEDVTHTLRTVRNVPLCLAEGAPNYLSVRGEVLFDLKGFERMNAERARRGEKTFENPRNAAAGTVRQLDPTVAEGRPLLFFAHSAGEGIDTDQATHHSDLLRRLSDLGFAINPLNQTCEGIDAVVERVAWLATERESLPYEIDGAVIKVDDREVW